MAKLLKPSLNWLLVFVPVTLALRYLGSGQDTAVFVCAALAIVPLAAWLGHATEHLAARTSQSVGGLLNATFGNATELIISLVALRGGLADVVKASLTGSIIGNLLLVLGAAMVAGGLRRKEQRFNATGARVRSTMLALAAIGLIVPAGFYYLADGKAAARIGDLSTEISVILLVTYALGLLFALRTHRHFFTVAGGDSDSGVAEWTLTRSFTVLAISTAAIGWMSEILVGSVETAAHALGMTNLFVGVVVVAIIGNAAEHASAITAAMADQMELSVEIAIGSSIQIALFVAPVLVLASHLVAPRPMDLVFTPAEVMAVVMAALITQQIAGDGESNWLEGVQLLAVYLVLALAFYFLPETGPQH